MSKLIDLTGKKFGKLLVLERTQDYISPSGAKKVQWLCKCDCGNTITLNGESLKRGLTKSCGCIRITTDILGEKFGKLTVVEFAGFYVEKDGKRQSKCKCKCDCGNEVIVLRSSLKKGHTTSCGCSRKGINTKHGHCRDRIYIIWGNIKNRCLNPNISAYKHYGGRGVTVCDEWKEFQPFYDWAMVTGYSDDLTIDRIDVNGNYEPSNCRWANKKTQANNKTTSRYITYNGKTQTLSQWADELGIKYSILSNRFHKHKWSIERTLTTPVKK